MSHPSFIAIYAGTSISDARLLAASGDEDLVEIVAARLLQRWPPEDPDPVSAALKVGRREALRLVAGDEE